MNVGRNDPCPCGSGLKYKKCCLAREDAARSRPFYGDDARASALRRLMAYGLSEELEGDRAIAELLFWGGRLDDLSEEEEQDLKGSDDSTIRFNSFFLFDVDVDGGKTPCDLFLARHPARLGPGEREALERLGRTQLRPYEVTEVRVDEGLRVRDLWQEGPQLWVAERAATHQLARWDFVALRLAESAPGVHEIEGGIYAYPRDEKDSVLAALREAWTAWAPAPVDAREGDTAVFFKRHAMLFQHLWLDRVALRPPPTLVTTEGDSLEFGTGIFSVVDAEALRHALDEHPAFHRDEDEGVYSWGEPGGRVLGTLRLGPADLVAEVQSRARMARLRELLKQHAGASVRFRSARYDDPWEMLQHSRERGAVPAAAEPGVPPEEAARFLREYKDAHYQRWLDEPVPLLGGRTPRKAARTTAGRAKLDELLKIYEVGEARGQHAGQTPYDFSWLRRELGLELPR